MSNDNCTCKGDGVKHTHVQILIDVRLPGDIDGAALDKLRAMGSECAGSMLDAFGGDPDATHFDAEIVDISIHEGPRSYEAMR